jgi:hypothetical protein
VAYQAAACKSRIKDTAFVVSMSTAGPFAPCGKITWALRLAGSMNCLCIGRTVCRYCSITPETDQSDYSNPLQLLAKELAFEDPVTKRQHRFVSQLNLKPP